ncbi:MAG: LytTR family DNA-binding domain-containing protein [Lachnospiraceae bacterium]|nr:LytTR family DNA-binding domain-containing protein [Lachnospiraceae bacterium]
MKIAICDDDTKEREDCARLLEILANKHGAAVEITHLDSISDLMRHCHPDANAYDIIYLDIVFGAAGEGVSPVAAAASGKGTASGTSAASGMSAASGTSAVSGTYAASVSATAVASASATAPEVTLDGVEAAKALRGMGCESEIIFFTVSRTHLMSAFDVNAFHYIVKGHTTPSKFEEIFLRAKEAVDEKNREYLHCSAGGESRYIDISTILYFTVKDRIIQVHYGDGQVFEFYSTIGKIENQLGACGFVRIHKKYIVSMNGIDTLTRKAVTLKNREILGVGKTYYTKVKQILDMREAHP